MLYYQMTPEQFLKLMESPRFIWGMIILSIWNLIWKGIALWRASRNYQKIWFIALLIVNTFGILEILYLFYFAGKKNKNLPSNSIEKS